jgi:hypothetical protein
LVGLGETPRLLANRARALPLVTGAGAVNTYDAMVVIVGLPVVLAACVAAWFALVRAA